MSLAGQTTAEVGTQLDGPCTSHSTVEVLADGTLAEAYIANDKTIATVATKIFILLNLLLTRSKVKGTTPAAPPSVRRRIILNRFFLLHNIAYHTNASIVKELI
jgi:hypothetical protein